MTDILLAIWQFPPAALYWYTRLYSIANTKEPDVCIPRRPAIMLVDDEPIMLTVLAYALDYLAPDYEVIALRDGAAALAHLAQRSVALVITDYHMPGMDGMALLGAMQATAPTCPVGLLTASLTPALAQRAQAAGAAFVLSKPFELVQLAALVQTVLLPYRGAA
jgi:two-component system, response regulator, stage 0 sporulation protein F